LPEVSVLAAIFASKYRIFPNYWTGVLIERIYYPNRKVRQLGMFTKLGLPISSSHR